MKKISVEISPQVQNDLLNAMEYYDAISGRLSVQHITTERKALKRIVVTLSSFVIFIKELLLCAYANPLFQIPGHRQ